MMRNIMNRRFARVINPQKLISQFSSFVTHNNKNLSKYSES